MYFQTKITIIIAVIACILHLNNGLKSLAPKTARLSQKLNNFASTVVDTILNSPFRPLIVDAARKTMVKSVEEVGYDWNKYYNTIFASQDWNTAVANVIQENPTLITPNYYKSPFHAYSEGNLCIQAALEQELASIAVGVRNFPSYRAQAQSHLRDLNDLQFQKLGGQVLPPADPTTGKYQLVDLGCGTGTSTRRLAGLFSHLSTAEIHGYDLSPHMIAVARYFQEAIPKQAIDWVESFSADNRISYHYGDLAQLPYPDNSVHVINLDFVFHELPFPIAQSVIKEANRVLIPGGVFAILEMDPTAPGYVKARKNPALFTIFKSTEPFLDQYFDETAPQLTLLLQNNGFSHVQYSAVTGRHFACIARKAGVVDLRPSASERLAMDEHLQPYESPLQVKRKS
jgi:ubiquinone/menaquinone biosynthesis C-methylase UbiE